MRLRFHPVLVIAVSCAAFAAQDGPAGPDDAAAYTLTITLRANKIVAAIDLADSATAARVADVIVRQYRGLNDIHRARDAKIAQWKSDPTAVAALRAEVEATLAPLHRAFLGRLSAELTPAQIEQVKDGLTYGVVPLTYRVYLQMLPTLTAAQKTQIMAWLVEAREHALDGSTADEKHAWFGKYKGRINNFLAAAGYNLKQAEKEMMARQKATPVSK